MSLELKIEALTATVERLNDLLQSNVTIGTVIPTAGLVATPSVATPFVAPVAAPVASAMPAPPSFLSTPAPVALTQAPFTDNKGLIEYAMTTYKTFGQEKGAALQGVITGLGYQNISDIKPEHYGDFYQRVEALKV